MKLKFCLLALLPFSIIAMKKKHAIRLINRGAIDWHQWDVHNEENLAYNLLSSEEIQCLSKENYRSDTNKAMQVIQKWAKLAGNRLKKESLLATSKKEYKQMFFKKKVNEFNCLYGSSAINWLEQPIDVVDEKSAKIHAMSVLAYEERKLLLHDGYRSNRDNAFLAIQHYAQLTGEELEKKKLLTTSKEEYAQKFIEEKVKELDSLWLSK